MGNRKKKPDTGVKGACPLGMPPLWGREGVTLAIPLSAGKDFYKASISEKRIAPLAPALPPPEVGGAYDASVLLVKSSAF